MKDLFSVLIIEDDFRVADIHRHYVEKTTGFAAPYIAKNRKEALDYLESGDAVPDLILLDIYIPDVERMNLLWELRQSCHDADIIIVSAEKDAKAVQEALRAGVFDYIVKPVDEERFSLTLAKYKEYRSMMRSSKEMKQSDIDALFGLHRVLSSVRADAALPKGIDSITLEKIYCVFTQQVIGGITAVELSSELGISRSTARRYLEYLVSLKRVRTMLIYGTVGRPERRYILCETYEQNR
ncbi:response regulator [Paenibacillus alvei]|uniref:Transcriptional regulatory protein n=2 Tax=Paenibacillus alvei TaxID=44250 RepID=A0AAP7DIM5_PAEAL|nr:response regulator [Paenibacillus alvei]MBG9733512.1 transcriptional regulator [Paenibacillus alvei]MBG9742633.1 transcriptional regulator [Paenibacillus alvei]MCY9581554.1 response regulator [Paenibacillus alvei]MCY9585439.1 response regulator [Paenibacillus alvei]NEZ42800.1 response regulator [Paenibacillus alvei]